MDGRKVFKYQCPHCGRRWDSTGGRTGFVVAAINLHVFYCKDKTPAERRAANAKDEKRWARNPPATRIRNNPQHAGLIDPLNPGVGGND